jgi:hypothetical protein
MQMQRLNRVMPEMLVKTRPPDHPYGVAGLQQRAKPRATAAADKAEMAAVTARHYLDDGAGLTVAPRPQHDAVISPFHARLLALTV